MKDTSKISKCEEENSQNSPKEIGGPRGLEPTRYGANNPEWEKNGRVSDF